MSYVIFHKETTIIFKTCATERAAKTALTKAANSGKIANRDQYSIEESIYFANFIEKKVTKTYLHPYSGLPTTVTMTVNTPRSCDPTSDLYWQM